MFDPPPLLWPFIFYVQTNKTGIVLVCSCIRGTVGTVVVCSCVGGVVVCSCVGGVVVCCCVGGDVATSCVQLCRW